LKCAQQDGKKANDQLLAMDEALQQLRGSNSAAVFQSERKARLRLTQAIPILYLSAELQILVRFCFVSTTTKKGSVWFTTKGQVVIPSWLRKQFNIEDGTKAIIQAKPEGILLKPVTGWSIERGFEVLKRKPSGKSFHEEWAEHKREDRELEDK
jgi:AbrB family looped-hinge helix DNA binding protein